MAPLKDRGGEGLRRWMDNGPQLLQRKALNSRQDNGNDNNGRPRFRGGNNRNNQDENEEEDSNRNNGNSRGNRGGFGFGGGFGGGGGNSGGNGGGNGGGSFGGGGGGGGGSGNNNNNSGDDSRRNGQNRSNGNGGGNGVGSGSGNGGGNGNGNGNGSGTAGGNGNGNRTGNGSGNNNSNSGNGNNRGNGSGNGRGNGSNNGSDKGDEENNKDESSGNNGNGGSGGRNRNGTDRTTDPSSTTSGSIEPTSSVPPPPIEPAPASEPAPFPAVTAEPVPPPTDPAVVPVDASVVPNQGAVILQSALAPTPPIEGNPTVTGSLPLVTPTGLDGLPSTQPVENAQLSNSVLPEYLAPAPTSVPPPELLDTNVGNRGNNQGDPTVVAPPGAGNVDNSNRLVAPQGGMDPTAERVLISVGSIGAFILVCFIAWMVLRTMKKSRKQGSRGGSNGPSLNRFISMIPFFGHTNSRSMDESTITGSPPPSYREKAGSPVEPSLDGFYGREKVPLVEENPPQAQPPQSQPQSQIQPRPQSQPQTQGQPSQQPPQLQLQTQFSPQQLQAGPGAVPFDQQTLQQGGFYQQPYNPNTAYSPANTLNFATLPSMAGVMSYNHQPQPSFSSTNAAQFGGYILPGDPNGPGIPLMVPTTYYNQSPVAQQELTVPSAPNQRKGGTRSSQVSSLSSGFGDEGMIVSNSLVTPLPPAKTPARASSHYPSRFSWQSQSQVQTKRDTVLTETSEDQPPRFRSLNSWVDQQAGRIQRTQQRGYNETAQQPVPQIPGHPGIPGIHNPPDEQSFNMMMDDEAPRRIESALPSSRIP